MRERFVDVSEEKGRIEQLQRMLRYLSFAYDDEGLRTNINGTFDASTERAVSRLQKLNGLPQTGKADAATWNAAVLSYEDEVKLRAPVYIYPIPQDPDHRSLPGERSDVIMILQVILGSLRQNYDYPAVPVSGVYGRETEAAVRYFQRINGIYETGEADRETWRRLAEEYNALVSQ